MHVKNIIFIFAIKIIEAQIHGVSAPNIQIFLSEMDHAAQILYFVFVFSTFRYAHSTVHDIQRHFY